MAKKSISSFSEHLTRYTFAAEYCTDKVVLDAGCKEGFGAHIISYAAKKVVLTDIRQDFLNVADRWYKFLCEKEIIQADLNKEFPASTDGFDVIVALELIDHLDKPEVFLQNARDNLKIRGRFIFSLPNMLEDDLHKVLYDEQKVRDLIGKYFVIDEFYIQDKKAISGKPLENNVSCFIGVCHKV